MHLCATSYIRLKSGKKIYLDDSFYNIKKRIENSKDEFINVNKSTITGSNRLKIKRDDIAEYGAV